MSDGIKYMLISTLFFSLMNICVKFLAHIPVYEIATFRSLGIVIFSFGLIRYSGISFKVNHKRFLALRSIFGTMAMLMYFYTLQNIPLATAVTLQYLSPIFASIIAVFLLKEIPDFLQWCFFGLSFAGVLLIKGFDARISIFFLCMGIGSALGSGFAYNYIRKLKTHDHPVIIVFYFALISLTILSPMTVIYWKPLTTQDCLVLFFLAICTQLAQINMTKAYQAEAIAIVSSFRYVGILFALALGFILFNESVPLMAFIGMVLVLSGVILAGYYPHFKKMKSLVK